MSKQINIDKKNIYTHTHTHIYIYYIVVMNSTDVRARRFTLILQEKLIVEKLDTMDIIYHNHQQIGRLRPAVALCTISLQPPRSCASRTASLMPIPYTYTHIHRYIYIYPTYTHTKTHIHVYNISIYKHTYVKMSYKCKQI